MLIKIQLIQRLSLKAAKDASDRWSRNYFAITQLLCLLLREISYSYCHMHMYKLFMSDPLKIHYLQLFYVTTIYWRHSENFVITKKLYIYKWECKKINTCMYSWILPKVSKHPGIVSAKGTSPLKLQLVLNFSFSTWYIICTILFYAYTISHIYMCLNVSIEMIRSLVSSCFVSKRHRHFDYKVYKCGIWWGLVKSKKKILCCRHTQKREFQVEVQIALNYQSKC